MYAVANQASVTSEALYKWRDRKTTPSLYLLECLCYALEVRLVDLLYDNSAAILTDPVNIQLFEHIDKLTNPEKLELLTYLQSHWGNKSDKKQVQ